MSVCSTSPPGMPLRSARFTSPIRARMSSVCTTNRLLAPTRKTPFFLTRFCFDEVRSSSYPSCSIRSSLMWMSSSRISPEAPSTTPPWRSSSTTTSSTRTCQTFTHTPHMASLLRLARPFLQARSRRLWGSTRLRSGDTPAHTTSPCSMSPPLHG